MALVVANPIERGPAERWVPFDDETEVLLRSLDDDLYQVGLARARRQINKADAKFKTGEVGVAEGEISEHAYQCKLLSQYILKDWRGAKDAEGRSAEFSPQAGEATLSASVEFFLFVVKSASEIAADAKTERSETVGKPSPATDGKPSKTS